MDNMDSINKKVMIEAQREAKKRLGLEIGPGKRVPRDRVDEFQRMVKTVLKASMQLQPSEHGVPS